MSAAFAAERRAAREGALLRVAPELAAFTVTGKDRLAWLNGLVTCELAKLEPGSGAYGLAVGKTGKISAELFFLAAEGRVVVGAPRDRLEMLREHFDRHLIMEDAEIGDTEDRAFVFAHGPLAGELVSVARGLGADAAMIDWTGRGDAAVIVAPEGKLDELVAALLARTGAAGAVVSDEAWEALRIEWGRPRFGVDFNEESMPQEASLEKLAVSFGKGCYLGQEAVFMLEKRGHAKKRLMRLCIEGDAPVAKGAELMLPDGAVVGTVTSVTPGPEGGLLAIGYVKYKHAVAGTALVVEGRGAEAIGLAAAR